MKWSDLIARSLPSTWRTPRDKSKIRIACDRVRSLIRTVNEVVQGTIWPDIVNTIDKVRKIRIAIVAHDSLAWDE